jgi:HD superfamily phosphodiesterase
MKCPGQDSRYWKPGSIFEAKCPQCGELIEFFKDDPTRRCSSCGQKTVNPNMDFGCAAYCRFADQCIGELPPELLAEREGLMKDRIAVEMKKYLKTDFKSIGHATRVARHAEAIAGDAGGDLAVILAAAYLHVTGAREALQKHGSAGKKHLEIESPPIARGIMNNIGANEALTEEVCGIISRIARREETPGDKNDLNLRILQDADSIAEIEKEFKEQQIDTDQIRKTIKTRVFTDSAKSYAEKLFLQ